MSDGRRGVCRASRRVTTSQSNSPKIETKLSTGATIYISRKRKCKTKVKRWLQLARWCSQRVGGEAKRGSTHGTMPTHFCLLPLFTPPSPPSLMLIRLLLHLLSLVVRRGGCPPSQHGPRCGNPTLSATRSPHPSESNGPDPTAKSIIQSSSLAPKPLPSSSTVLASN